MKISIITPTILRESLVKTCESIDAQDYEDYEHIIMIDVNTVMPKSMLQKIKNPKRKIFRCPEPHKNYGNTCRHNAWKKATGEYILYLDDDDLLVRGALKEIMTRLEGKKPDALVFPAQKDGNRFFNIPPASTMTLTGQYMHKKFINGKAIKWPRRRTGDNGYLYDGEFVEKLKQLTDFYPISSERALINVESSNHGQRAV